MTAVEDLETALDHPVRASLLTRHAGLARRHGSALGYRPEVATFVGVPPEPEAADWADVATLLGPGGFADLFGTTAAPPADWEPVFALPGLQLVADRPLVASGADVEVVLLGEPDVPDMLDLVARTRPGPFWSRTCEMGDYLGVRDGGRLVAMAGERLRPVGATEISAVCTAPEARGRGLAARLVGAVAERVRARGELPFLHVAAANTTALDLYLRLGLEVRREVTFRGFRVPQPR